MDRRRAGRRVVAHRARPLPARAAGPRRHGDPRVGGRGALTIRRRRRAGPRAHDRDSTPSRRVAGAVRGRCPRAHRRRGAARPARAAFRSRARRGSARGARWLVRRAARGARGRRLGETVRCGRARGAPSADARAHAAAQHPHARRSRAQRMGANRSDASRAGARALRGRELGRDRRGGGLLRPSASVARLAGAARRAPVGLPASQMWPNDPRRCVAGGVGLTP